MSYDELSLISLSTLILGNHLVFYVGCVWLKPQSCTCMVQGSLVPYCLFDGPQWAGYATYDPIGRSQPVNICVFLFIYLLLLSSQILLATIYLLVTN